MTSSANTDYAEVESTVEALLALCAAERVARLAALAEEAPALAARVDALLKADARLGDASFLAEPLVNPLANDDVRTDEPIPTPLPESIDRYRILKHLGSGGMGAVYLAEQSEPVQRQVAIKVTHAFQSQRDRTRFSLEAQALASMQHPNIAALHDSGTTEDGMPFVVMELVEDAMTILEWCDHTQASLEERLALFLQVCAGVAHAHEKGLLHRDIKPANVLVTRVGGKPLVKVIDFGIARTFVDEDGRAISEASVAGSPVYMSPEAIGGDGKAGLDTRSDVYSLGLLLCELISGDLPFPPDASLGALVERIRSERVTAPAERLASQALDRLEAIAGARSLSVAGLRRAVSGDLDAIVMKAIAFDRELRYASPRDLARDVERHLQHQPIEARPPHWTYHLRRFIRRNRAAAAAATLVFGTMVAFTITTSVQAERIAAERDRANREAQAKGFVANFLTELFSKADPYSTSGEAVTARELLDRGAESIGTAFDAQPDVKAALLDSMGTAYRMLGIFPQSEALLQQALATRRELFGEQHLLTLESMGALGALYYENARVEEAESLQLAAVEGFESALRGDDLRAAQAQGRLARVYARQGRYELAEPRYIASIAQYERLLGASAEETLVAKAALGAAYMRQQRLDEAEPLVRASAEGLERVSGKGDPRTLDSLNLLAVLSAMRGDYKSTEPLFVELLARYEEVAGRDHFATQAARNNLGVLYKDTERYESAETLFLENLESRRRSLGDEHPETLNGLLNIAHIYQSTGRRDLAIETYRNVLTAQRRVQGADHPETMEVVMALGDALFAQQETAPAAALYQEAAKVYTASVGQDNPLTIKPVYRVALSQWRQGNAALAAPLYRDVIARAKRTYGEKHLYTAHMLFDYACVLAMLGEQEQATAVLTEAVDAGFFDVPRMREQPELAVLRGDRFDQLVAEAAANPDELPPDWRYGPLVIHEAAAP
ncbi:MAG: serine/threonine-protein kinase [Pseudomonadota bacterium]